MSTSRFVSSSAADHESEHSDAWAKAQKAINESKAKGPEQGRQEGGKSLYEVLQQNKAAQQEAFEENLKLKNQFRGLEPEEVEYLDSIVQEERQQNEQARRETQQQLEAFKKLQRVTGGQSDQTPLAQHDNTSISASRQWLGSKKRRREKEQVPSKVVKPRQSTDTTRNKTPGALVPAGNAMGVRPNRKPDEKQNSPIATPEKTTEIVKAKLPKPANLGLSVYEDSDED